MNLENKAPFIKPEVEERMGKGYDLSDSSTQMGNVKLLKDQINTHNEEIKSRDDSQASDLKNDADRAIIKDLENKIKNIQEGTVKEEGEEERILEEPYLKS